MEFTKLFFDVDLKYNVIKCDNIKPFAKMPLLEFYDKYLDKIELGIIDSEYSYSSLINVLAATEDSNIYLFSSDKENIFYQLEIVRNNDRTYSCFLMCLNNVKNYDNYGKTDYLTNIDSRNSFLKKVNVDFEKRTFEEAAVIMLDIDNFKGINDNFGHIVGDYCLQQVASKITNIIGEDYVGRYGGDEFIIFIKNPKVKDMDSIINQLINIRYSSLDKVEIKINLRLSLGVCYFNINEKYDFKTYIQRADSALYDAKNNGKNTFEIYGQHINNKKSKKIHFFGNNFILFKDEIKRNRKFRILGIFFTIAILIFAATSSTLYYTNRLQDTIDRETQETMEDVSSQVSLALEQQFVSWLGELNMASAAIDYNNASDSLNQIKSLVSFDDVAFLLDDGNLFFDEERGVYDVAADNVAKSIIINNTSYVGRIYLSYSGEFIIFGIPLNQLGKSVSDMAIAGIVGLTSIASFNENISSSLYDGNLLVSIIGKDGTIIGINSSKDENLNGYNNMFNIFENNLNDAEYTKIKQNLIEGASFTTKTKINGEQHFVYSCTPDSISEYTLNEWRIVLMVPTEVLSQKWYLMVHTVVAVYLIVFITFSTLIIYLSIIHSKNISKMQVLTYVDTLTNDINEKRFVVDAEKILHMYPDKKYALIYFNIMHFKFFNETYGTELGNQIILKIYKILINNIKKWELTARVFADRFVCLKEYSNDEEIISFIDEINEEISKIELKNCIFKINLLAGVYRVPNKKSSIEIGIDKANMALDCINGEYVTSNVNFFSDELMNKNNEIVFFEQNQEKALDKQEFLVYYQPKRDIKNDRYLGAEALVRWNNGEKGMIGPDKFIPLFEKNGFIVRLDAFVFEQVCKDIRKMIDTGEKKIVVSVNLSGKHLLIDNFFENYIEIMDKYQVPHECIEFEVTESVLLENESKLVELISNIHKIGCSCSIDDFGSGFSSLNMFKDFDFDVVKLDKKFFYGIKGLNESTKTIIKTIVELSHQLNKKVVAEGIEKEEQVQFLKDIGCDYIQGYYYSKPESFDNFRRIIKK